jgi:uncharacterized protein YfaA (DUF2138 family)
METTDFLWKLLENILTAVLPILASALTVWLVQKIREAGKKINADQMYYIRLAVGIAVTAAEQAGLAKLITDKKQYALEITQAYLNKQNIKVDIALIDGLIEAAVGSELPEDIFD